MDDRTYLIEIVQQGEGATQLLDGLRETFEVRPTRHAGRSRIVVPAATASEACARLVAELDARRSNWRDLAYLAPWG